MGLHESPRQCTATGGSSRRMAKSAAILRLTRACCPRTRRWAMYAVHCCHVLEEKPAPPTVMATKTCSPRLKVVRTGTRFRGESVIAGVEAIPHSTGVRTSIGAMIGAAFSTSSARCPQSPRHRDRTGVEQPRDPVLEDRLVFDDHDMDGHACTVGKLASTTSSARHVRPPTASRRSPRHGAASPRRPRAAGRSPSLATS